MGIFNWGIYFGYGLSYAIGNFVTEADIFGLGWRASYFVSGILGFVVAILLFVVVKEPIRKGKAVRAITEIEEESCNCVLKSHSSLCSESKSHSRSCLESKSYSQESHSCLCPESKSYSQESNSHSFLCPESVSYSQESQFSSPDSKSPSCPCPESQFPFPQSQSSRTLDSEGHHHSRVNVIEETYDDSCWTNLWNGETGMKQVFKVLLSPPIFTLTVAACVRHVAGFTWAYNTQQYFNTYYPSFNLGIWITAVSIIGGTLGVACGGLASDRLVKRIGLRARVYVLAASQLAATPFAVGVLFFAPPVSFYILLFSYLFAEMWFGVLFAILLELIPNHIHSTSIAVFLFIMNNIGGNAPVLIEPLRQAFSYRTALLIMYPGFYFLSSLLFFFSSFFVPNDRQKVHPTSAQ